MLLLPPSQRFKKAFFSFYIFLGRFLPFSPAMHKCAMVQILFSFPSIRLLAPAKKNPPGKRHKNSPKQMDLNPVTKKEFVRQSGNSAFSSSSFDLRDLFGMSSKGKAQKSLSPLPTSPPLFNLPSPPFPTAAPFKKRLKRPRKCPFPSPSSFDQCRWCLRSLLTWGGASPAKNLTPHPE